MPKDPLSYLIAVDYRTRSGGNTRNVQVMADDFSEAVDLAHAQVRNMRGVVKIDGGTLIGAPVPGQEFLRNRLRGVVEMHCAAEQLNDAQKGLLCEVLAAVLDRPAWEVPDAIRNHFTGTLRRKLLQACI